MHLKMFFFQDNAFEYVICIMAAISFRPQYVKTKVVLLEFSSKESM